MPYEVDERITELTDKLENGIKDIYTSEQYAQYIAAMSQFHHYSFGNALLILFQCPTASLVAGYGKWKTLGRHVKKNEHGIQILAPCPYKKAVERTKTDPATGRAIIGPDGKPVKEREFVEAAKFKIATVFDVSQTEGKELPRIGVAELTGDVPDYEAIYDRLTALSPLPVVMEPIQSSKKGYTSFTEQKIGIKSGMSQVQTIKTLVHELAHAMLHDPDGDRERPEKRQREVEAESVAYVVCQRFGVDTSDYSFAYVAGWSRGRELAELKASLNVIHSTAGAIIEAISPEPQREQEQPKKEYKPTARRR